MTAEEKWIVAALVLAAAAFLVIVSTTDGDAHDAAPTAAQPEGWSYPFACCGGYDCRRVPGGRDGVVSERPEGYVIGTTGEVVAYTDARVKQSPDGDFHWCSVAGKADGKTICLFVPPRAF